MHASGADNALRHLDFAFFDVLAMQIAFNLAYWINGNEGILYADTGARMTAVIIMIVQLALGLFSDVYSRIFIRNAWEEYKSLLFNTIHIALFAGAFLIIAKIPVRRLEIAMSIGLFFNMAFFIHELNKARHLRKGLPKRRVIVVAAGCNVQEAIRRMGEKNHSAAFELTCIVLMDESDGARFTSIGVPVYYLKQKDLLNLLSRLWIDDAFILVDEALGFPSRLMEDFLLMGISVHMGFSVLDQFKFAKTDVGEMGSYKVITSSINVVSDRQLMEKRAIDILGGLVGCLFTGIVFIFIAPLIYIKSPGPIFFKQPRIGLNGRVFMMYKFRSMYMDAEKRKAELMEKNKIEGGLMFKIDDDPRIIGSEKKGKDGKPKGIGNFIRNTSLDEFPQFFNVLKGDMSLVGTRPPTLDEWNHYDPRHRVRMSARPGITGMWQVSGRSEITDFEEVVALDQKYIENWSLWLDLRILCKTMLVVLRHEGAV